MFRSRELRINMRRISMKLITPVAAAITVVCMALPAAAQTTDTGSRTDRCNHITDPGLRSQCITQSYSSGDRLQGTPNTPATAPLVPTTPNRPDIVPGQPPRR
jgi:hypothetical protein